MFTKRKLKEIDESSLSPHAARVLSHYHAVGDCMEPVRTTASHCRMSAGKVSEVRRELAAGGWLDSFGASAETFTRAGYVYLMESGGLYKIGVSKEPEQRLKTIARSLLLGVKLIHSFWCEDAYLIESKLHGKFASKRVRGEWFNLSPDDIDHIASY